MLEWGVGGCLRGMRADTFGGCGLMHGRDAGGYLWGGRADTFGRGSALV